MGIAREVSIYLLYFIICYLYGAPIILYLELVAYMPRCLFSNNLYGNFSSKHFQIAILVSHHWIEK